VVETARAHLDEFADSSLDFTIARNLLIQRGRSVGTLRSDQVTIERLPTDLSASMNPEELVDVLETNRADLQAGLAMYSDKLLSQAVHRVSAYGQRHSIGTKQVAHEISQVIANERRPLQEIIEQWRGIITIERDYSLDSKNRPADLVNMRVSADRQGKQIQAWVPETTEWHEPMQLLCAAVTEVETVIALNEWVIARKLPYLPVGAPLQFEQGYLADPSGKNMRADILLCCLLPERNEIIPTQVKNSTSVWARDEYHPGVALVAPRNLGQESAAHFPVKVGGRVRTGLRTITQYGGILDHYLTVRGKATRGHKQPSKKSLRAYAEALQPAFNHFDREIFAQIKAYDQACAQPI